MVAVHDVLPQMLAMDSVLPERTRSACKRLDLISGQHECYPVGKEWTCFGHSKESLHMDIRYFLSKYHSAHRSVLSHESHDDEPGTRGCDDDVTSTDVATNGDVCKRRSYLEVLMQ